MPYKVFTHSDLMGMSDAPGIAGSLADSLSQLEQTGYVLQNVVSEIGSDYNRSLYIFRKPETGTELFDRFAQRFK